MNCSWRFLLIIMLRLDCANDFNNSYHVKAEVSASSMQLLKPKAGQLPRAPQKNRKKQPVHPGGAISIFKHEVSDATL